MAPIVYTEEGQALKDQIWDETLAEFGFANMGGIINGLAGASSSATK